MEVEFEEVASFIHNREHPYYFLLFPGSEGEKLRWRLHDVFEDAEDC